MDDGKRQVETQLKNGKSRTGFFSFAETYVYK